MFSNAQFKLAAQKLVLVLLVCLLGGCASLQVPPASGSVRLCADLDADLEQLLVRYTLSNETAETIYFHGSPGYPELRWVYFQPLFSPNPSYACFGAGLYPIPSGASIVFEEVGHKYAIALYEGKPFSTGFHQVQCRTLGGIDFWVNCEELVLPQETRHQ